MFVGTSPEYARQHNLRVVLEAVRQLGASSLGGASRAELARRTGLTVQTVHNITDELIGLDLLSVRGKRVGQRGQPAAEFELNPDGAYAIGLHLDRDHLTAVLVDLVGKVRHRLHRELDMPSPAVALPLMARNVQTLLRRVPDRSKLWGVGVAMPGPIEQPGGVIVRPPNFEGWDGVNVREALEKTTGLPVLLRNDGTAAALGERWYGLGREHAHFFYVFYGIGLGGGIVIDGRTLDGARGNAAEFGHIPVVPHGRPCTCGGRGCVEQYASMANLYATLRAAGHGSPGRSALVALHTARDPTLLGWLDQAATHLTPALIAAANLLNPTAIIFGGRLPEPLMDELISRVRQKLPDYQMQGLRYAELLRGEVTQDAACLGAATLPLYEQLGAQALDVLPTSPPRRSLPNRPHTLPGGIK